MKKIILGLLAIYILGGVNAQTNFSGNWKINYERTELGIPGGNVGSILAI
jgi:hypothetical protein